MSSLGISAKIAAVVGSAQVLIMLVLWSVPSAPAGLAGVVLNVVLLAILALPVVLIWIIRPYVRSRDVADAGLQETNKRLQAEIQKHEELEEQLRERAIELETHMGQVEFNRSLIEEQAAGTVAIAEDLAAQKQEIEESKRESEHLANHDPLTGLPNRRHFETVLKLSVDLAQCSDTAIALLFIDLDNFKAVNDTLGHQRGDDLLKDVAERLQATVRGADVVARLGGDEFAVIAQGIRNINDRDIAVLAERVRAALAIPADTLGDIAVHATIGVATFPLDTADCKELVTYADQAMYAAKNQGRNRVVHYQNIAESSGVERRAS